MKVIIAGSRDILSRLTKPFVISLIDQAVEDSGWEVSEVVSGCARGVDRIGEEWAEANLIPVRRFPAQWQEFGRRAGMIRNHKMAEYADGLIAVWDGESPGTRNMVNVMAELGKSFIQLTIAAKETIGGSNHTG